MNNEAQIFTSSFIIRGILKSDISGLSAFMESFGGIEKQVYGSRLCYRLKNSDEAGTETFLELSRDKVTYTFTYRTYSIMKNISHMANFLVFVHVLRDKYEFNYDDALPYVTDLLKNCNISASAHPDEDLLIERLSNSVKRLNLANIKLSRELYDAALEIASCKELLRSYKAIYAGIYDSLTKKGGVAEKDFAKLLGVDGALIKKLKEIVV